MSFLWALGGFFLVLTPIILVHEYGHFLAARLSNIRVEEFGLGFPPRAATLFKRNGTIFSLNWIPLGGFVRPLGEDDPTVPGGLAAAPKRSRFFVLVAGALANFILAFIIFWVMFILPRPELMIAVSEVADGSPAAVADLQADDIFLSVNGKEIGDNFNLLVDEIKTNAGKEVTFVMLRNGEEQAFTIVPRRPGEYDASEEGALGVRLAQFDTGRIVSMPPTAAAVESGRTIGEIIYMTLSLPVRLIQGQIAPEEARVVSVVGISQMAGQATQLTVDTGDISYVLWLAGVISVALGFTNLLPIPALDGGRILFVLVEAIRGRRIEPEQESMVHAVGMALLLGLMVILIVQDIVNPIVFPS